MDNVRKYRGSDIGMLTASQTIVKNFKSYIEELAPRRTNWNPEYADGLDTKIKMTASKYLGTNPKIPLVDATALVESIMKPAFDALSSFKTDLGVDFPNKEEQKRILSDLGFTKNYEKIRNRSQEATIELLYAFTNNMTTSLRTKVTSHGMKAEIIDKIIGYATVLSEANVDQESLKLSTKLVTSEAIQEFNKIYKEIIGICKIASNFYKDQPQKKALFTYTKILAPTKNTKPSIKPAA
jgi:hypothetical protein